MIVKRGCVGYVCGMCECVAWRHGGHDDGHDDDDFIYEIAKTY